MDKCDFLPTRPLGLQIDFFSSFSFTHPTLGCKDDIRVSLKYKKHHGGGGGHMGPSLSMLSCF